MSKIILNSSKISHTEVEFFLSGSKSISQRVLVINYLSNFHDNVENLSNSDDTNVLYNALYFGKSIINVKNSGTALRFLISVFALKNVNITLTGSEYLLQRPITPLIELLNLLGGRVFKENNEIYIQKSNLIGSVLNLDVLYTSQFISSLLLISPYLQDGITFNMPKKIYSGSYIDMTVSIMKHCGAKIAMNNNTMHVSHHHYSNNLQFIESDWTSASYLFLAFLFSKLNSIIISTLYKKSMQNDQVIVDFFSLLGVSTIFDNNNVILKKINHSALPQKIAWDFIDNPDLFPTILVACFGLGIDLFATGLTTLAYKESNRIMAMKNELEKFDCIYTIESKDAIYMQPNNNTHINKELICIETYNDHRIALSLSPLVLLGWELQIDNPLVINKSYPDFWTDLCKFGVKLKSEL